MSIEMTTSAQTTFIQPDEAGAPAFHMRSLAPLAPEITTAAEPSANTSAEPSAATTTTVEPAAERVSVPVAPAEAVSLPLPVPTPLNVSALEPTYMRAYLDTFRILKDDNTCSRFFGGSSTAVEVLNRLTGQLKRKPLEKSTIAIRMSGDYILVQNHKTGVTYRLFDEATINSRGPLSGIPLGGSLNTSIGRFPTSTREAKALMLLHELGHLMRDSKGEWLLPNDGKDLKLSVRNTEIVEEHCLKQLLGLAE
jgi:hypothetical protein